MPAAINGVGAGGLFDFAKHGGHAAFLADLHDAVDALNEPHAAVAACA